MHHDRIDAGLLHQHDVLREIRRRAAAGHGVAAELHDDGLLVVFQDVGQGLDEDAGGGAPARHHAQIAFLAELVRQRHKSNPLETRAL